MGPCVRRDDDLKLPRTPTLHRALELLAEIGKFIGGDVADRPVVQATLAPAPDVESLDGFGSGRAAFGARGLRHEQIDHVAAAAVDHRTDGTGIDIVEPAADQGKTL